MKKMKLLDYTITLPEGWNYIGELLPPDFVPEMDEASLLRDALQNPIGAIPLRERKLSGKKVTIVVDDITRPTPVGKLFKYVLGELRMAGCRYEDITILVAVGTHRKLELKEIKNKLDFSELGRFSEVVNHDCFNKNELRYVGAVSDDFPIWVNRHIVESDLVVLLGTIEPHSLVGFGGGLKNIIPGCAGIDSIVATHLSGKASTRFANVGKPAEECSIRLAIEKGADMVDTDYFLVNTVLTLKGRIAGVFCGDPVSAHRNGSLLAKKVYGIPVDRKADVLLLNSYPMNADFSQGTKCFANSVAAAKEGALLVAFMNCKEGLGVMTLPKRFLSVELMRLFACEIGTERLIDIRERFSGKMSMYDKFMQQNLCELSKKYHILVYSPELSEGVGKRFGFFENFVSVDSLIKRAKELAPAGSTVFSLPYAGGSYVYYSRRE